MCIQSTDALLISIYHAQVFSCGNNAVCTYVIGYITYKFRKDVFHFFF